MDSELYNAAVEGELEIIIRKYADQLERALTPNNNTILHIFITSQTETTESPNFVEEILQICKPLLTQTNVKGETPLHIAARYGHTGIVKVLIDQEKALSEDIESGVVIGHLLMLQMTNVEMDTALHEAVRNNHLEVVRMLLTEDPCFPYSANGAGETPLYIAAERGYLDVVDEILRTCRSPDFSGPLGRTAMHTAVIRENQEMIKKLHENNLGGLITKADQHGWTPLHYAAHFGHNEIAKLLLQFDKSVAYIPDNVDKVTALHIAARRGQPKVIEEIVVCCPDCCELVDNKGWNVLHFAAESGNLQAVALILNMKSFSNLINEKDKHGDTPLHLAALSTLNEHPSSDKLPITHLLESRGVDAMAFNKNNRTALDVMLLDDKLPKAMDKTDDLESMWLVQTARQLQKGPKKKETVKEDAVAVLLCGQRILHEKNVTLEENLLLVDKKVNAECKRVSQIHLVVAILIATVTFAAGFTIPGGFKNDESQNPGSAILTKKVAFQAFVITDTLSMVFSVSAVFLHLFLAMTEETLIIRFLFFGSFLLTILAMGFMIVAFMTGFYAVLQRSLWLAVLICIISSCFFVYYYCVSIFGRFGLSNIKFGLDTFQKKISKRRRREKVIIKEVTNERDHSTNLPAREPLTGGA